MEKKQVKTQMQATAECIRITDERVYRPASNNNLSEDNWVRTIKLHSSSTEETTVDISLTINGETANDFNWRPCVLYKVTIEEIK